VARFKSAERRRRGTRDRARRDTWRQIRLGDGYSCLGLVLSIQSTGPGSNTCRASWAGEFLCVEPVCPCSCQRRENQQIEQRTASSLHGQSKTEKHPRQRQRQRPLGGMGTQLIQTQVQRRRGSTSSAVHFNGASYVCYRYQRYRSPVVPNGGPLR
jgi:hypothetical protein